MSPKYLAQVNCANNGGCFRKNSDSLDEIRQWAKSVGRPGETLLIQPNGKDSTHARTFTL